LEFPAIKAALIECVERLRHEQSDAFLDINGLKRLVRDAGGDDSLVERIASLDGASGLTVAETIRFLDGYIAAKGDPLQLATKFAGTALATGVSGATGVAAALTAPQTIYRVNLRLPAGRLQVQTFGRPAFDLVDESASKTELLSVFHKRVLDIQSAGDGVPIVSKAEMAWLQHIASHPAADRVVRLEIVALLTNVVCSDSAIAAGASAFSKTLIANADARELPFDHWSFGATSPIPKDASIDELRKMLTSGWEGDAETGTGVGPHLSTVELAWLESLSTHPASTQELRNEILQRVSTVEIALTAVRAGAVPFLNSLLPKGPAQKWNFGEPRASLPRIAENASSRELHERLEQGFGPIASGGWLSRAEVAWLQLLASHPNADDDLRAEVRTRAAGLRLSSDATAAKARSYLDSLPLPDTDGQQKLFNFGRPSRDLRAIPKMSSTEQLHTLLADDNNWGCLTDGKLISCSEAAWLHLLTSHPNADDALRGKVLQKIADLRPTTAALNAGFDVYVQSIRPFGKNPIEVEALVEAMLHARNRLRTAAGADGALSSDEVLATTQRLTDVEARVVDLLFDEIGKRASGVPIPVDEIVALTNEAVVAIGQSDLDGDGIEREELVRVGALGATVIELGRWIGGEKAPVIPVFKQTDFGNLNGPELIQAIRVQASTHLHLSYTRARRAMFKNIDNKGGVVRDVYTGLEVETNDIPGADGPRGMNTEHTWPKSRGVKDTPALSDIHHLFPTETLTNAKRDSYPFGVVSDVIWSREEAKLGINDKGHIVFEPPAEHRGNVARALFFISAVYGLPIDDEEETVLRRWHNQDPVDDDERKRNDAVSQYQGNRNPIVDLVELVERIGDF